MRQIPGLTKRCWIHMGYSCNNKCLFCHYRDSLGSEDKSTKEVKKLLKIVKKKGIIDVELTGGEPTIREDIFEILSFAKHLGFKDICVITNGSRMYKIDFCKKLIKNGATSFLFSIEGSNSELHDYLTQTKGSFQKIIKSIENIKKLKIPFQTNTTVTRFNHKNLPSLSKLLLKFKPRLVNFLIYWPFADGEKYYNSMAARCSEMKPYLQRSIEVLENKVEDINMRYFPFCILQGYEKHVCGYHQKIYDKEQWNNVVMDQIKHGLVRNGYHILRGMLSFKNKSRMFKLPFKNLIGEAMVEFIISKQSQKLDKCKSCKYYFICNGFWKSYIKLYGAEEIKPIYGEKILDPLFFRKVN